MSHYDNYKEREQKALQTTVKSAVMETLSRISSQVNEKVIVINNLSININYASEGGASIRVNSPGDTNEI